MKRVMMAGVVAACMVVGAVGPAWASGSVHHNTTVNANGGDGGNATAIAGGGNASATGGTHVQTNTQINSQTSVNTNVNTQGQQQGQGQVQGQSADNKGNKQSVKFESHVPSGIAVAPGLTSGGTQVCLGSFSVGISGPMAGVAFGKTVVDKGCEDRQNAILLHNMGYAAEALELLKGGNERVRALFAPAATAAPQAAMQTIPQAMEQTQQRAVVGVQGN